MPKLPKTKSQKGGSKSARERAYLCIQQKIADRKISAGSTVSEVALAAELGLSRTPVHEAIRQLLGEGLLEEDSNGSMVVVRLSRQDFTELYELREMLEAHAVSKITKRRPDAKDLERLQALAGEIRALRNQLIKSGKKTLNEAQMRQFEMADIGLHTFLMSIAENAAALKFFSKVRYLIRVFAARHTGHDAEALAKIHKEHLEMIHAMAEGDADKAVQAVSRHIQASRQERLKEYSHWEREALLRNQIRDFFRDERSEEIIGH
ncbi:MAG: GntR family transcriptional regulator [Candidatus Aminicenantes bacterium]|nr:GntR family transcriptional regulator [Candidatus Aminicenantes bacterium]